MSFECCQFGNVERCCQTDTQMEYGVSWQIAPAALEKMVEDLDRQKAQRVMIALYGMKKIDIEGLKQVYEGK